MLKIALITLASLVAIIYGAYRYMNHVAEKFKKARAEKKEELIQRINKGDVNARDENGYTLLMIAARGKFADLVIELIKNGAKVNEIGPAGDTALHHAAHFSSEKIVKALIRNGAEIDVVDDKGYTPLWFAAQSNNEKIVQELIDNGADINHIDPEFKFTPLMVASQNGNWRVIDTLLDNGADYFIQSPQGTAYEIAENRLKSNLKRLNVDNDALQSAVERLKKLTNE